MVSEIFVFYAESMAIFLPSISIQDHLQNCLECLTFITTSFLSCRSSTCRSPRNQLEKLLSRLHLESSRQCTCCELSSKGHTGRRPKGWEGRAGGRSRGHSLPNQSPGANTLSLGQPLKSTLHRTTRLTFCHEQWQNRC